MLRDPECLRFSQITWVLFIFNTRNPFIMLRHFFWVPCRSCFFLWRRIKRMLFSSHKVITFFFATWLRDGGKQQIMRTCTHVVPWLRETRRYICVSSLRAGVRKQKQPWSGKEKSSGPFETSLKRKQAWTFPNKASLWRGGGNNLCTSLVEKKKTGIQNETERAQTTLTFIKEILTLNDK